MSTATDSPRPPPVAPASEAGEPGADASARARSLFRYLGGEEWQEYRDILGVFAGTFFAEFSPDDVVARLGESTIDPDMVPDRLESLRRWGNLTVSSSVGNPSSLDDYYRRRNRYLITRVGQEVFELVERVLAGFDEIGDVQASRLSDLRRALTALVERIRAGVDPADSEEIGALTRTVFDVHERFTTELTQFFAELNLWQSRYDLDAGEVRFFAGVLVEYVSEQLGEISRQTRPIGRALEAIDDQLADLLPLIGTGLAGRVDEAGLGDQVTVRRAAGSRREDWEHLNAWFVATPGRASRLDQLTGQAVAAVRTLTANLTRLSRVGLGAASRRADFVRLAAFFDEAESVDHAHVVATAAFGLASCRHLSVVADDIDDPAPTITPWTDAPRAQVPVALRARGDRTQRGRTSPVRDRSQERELLRRKLEQARVETELIAAELLGCGGADGTVDGAELSTDAFRLLRDLIGRSSQRARAGDERRWFESDGLRCEVRRRPGIATVVTGPDGTLTLLDLEVSVRAPQSIPSASPIPNEVRR